MDKKPRFVSGDDIQPWDREPHNYTLMIRVDPGEEEVVVDIAMSIDSGLEIFSGTTPFERSFVTGQYYIHYEARSRSSRVTAQLHGDRFGDFMKLGAKGGGGRGRFIYDPRLHISCAGGR